MKAQHNVHCQCGKLASVCGKRPNGMRRFRCVPCNKTFTAPITYGPPYSKTSGSGVIAPPPYKTGMVWGVRGII